MDAGNVSVTDDVVREIGEQVSQAMRRKLPRWDGTSFDIARGVEMYQEHLQTFKNLEAIQINKDRTKNKSDRQIHGKSFEELDASGRRRDRIIAYTTDDLADLLKNNPHDSLFQDYPKLRKYAKRNHPQTDIVEIQNGDVRTIQHKNYEDPASAVRAFLKDSNNDEYRVPRDKFKAHCDELDKMIAKGGEDAKAARRVRRRLTPSDVSSSEARRPLKTVISRAGDDALKRAAGNIADGVISDIAVFAVGGAAKEIRDAYQNPDEMAVLDRCARLIRTIWQRFLATLKDRSVREIGAEVIAAAASVLRVYFRMAAAAIKKIVKVMRRLWMDFVAGKLKTLADVVAAALKAVFVVASVGVALAVETKLAPLFAGLPFGDILAALCAAVIAGVMIVVGNRTIEAVVLSLFHIFEGAAKAKLRREEIEKLCAEALPQLVEDRERLEALVESYFPERQLLLERKFSDLQSAHDAGDIDGFVRGLCGVNKAYSSVLPWCNFDEADSAMLSDKIVDLRTNRAAPEHRK